MKEFSWVYKDEVGCAVFEKSRRLWAVLETGLLLLVGISLCSVD